MNQPWPPGALAAASEDAIVLLAMNGDDAAYGELVRRRQGSIRNLLRRLTHDAALADDISQQVFVQAWRSIQSLKSSAAFGAWLRKLAVNFWLQHVRGRNREVALGPGDIAGADSPITAVSRQLDLDAALARLAPDVRLCVVLAYSEGLSHGEINQATSIPLGTVKSHIARGSALLRELLNAYGDAHAR